MTESEEPHKDLDAGVSVNKTLQYVLSQHSGEIVTPQLIEKIIIVFAEIMQTR